MSEFEIWVYRGLAIVLITIIGYGLKKLIAKIDELIEAIQKLAMNDVKQAQQIDTISDRLKVNDERLKDHSNRIRCLETKNRKDV